MAVIREYTSNVAPLRPDETGVEATARAGRNQEQMAGSIQGEYARAGQLLGQGFHTLGGDLQDTGNIIEKAQTVHQISQGAMQSAQFLEDHTQTWNAIASDPANANDLGTARQKFLTGMQDDLTKFSGQFSTPAGQEWAANHAASLLEHFTQKTTTDVSTIAGETLKTNLLKQTDALGSTVHADPSTLDFALSSLKPQIDSLVANTHGLDPRVASTAGAEALQSAQSRLVQLGIKGAIDKNVSAGLSMMKSDKYASMLKPEQLQELDNYGKAVTRANRADAAISAANAERAQRQASEARFQNTVKSFVGTDGQIAIPDGAQAKILQSGMQKGDMLSALSLADSIQRRMDKPPVVSNDPHVTADLLGRTGDPDHPTTKADITDALDKGQITFTAANDLMRQVSDPNGTIGKLNADPVVKSMFADAFARINGTTSYTLGGANSAVQSAQAGFKADTLRTLQDALAQGQDIKHFLDPKSDDYLFSQERIDKYAPSPEQIRSGLLGPRANTAGAAVQRATGDTAAPRVGGGRVLQPAQREDLGSILGKALQFSPKAAPIDEDWK